MESVGGRVRVREARVSDITAVARLRHELWPDGPVDEHAAELPDWLADDRACSFVADADGVLVGFVEGRLRSHADECLTSPVAFLEGWYVTPDWRRAGVGRALVLAFERWARDLGCAEAASDAALDNTVSHDAHRRLGFVEVSRAVNFRKELRP